MFREKAKRKIGAAAAKRRRRQNLEKLQNKPERPIFDQTFLPNWRHLSFLFDVKSFLNNEAIKMAIPK